MRQSGDSFNGANNGSRFKPSSTPSVEWNLQILKVLLWRVYATGRSVLCSKSLKSRSYIMYQCHPFIINTNWHNKRPDFMQMSRDAMGLCAPKQSFCFPTKTLHDLWLQTFLTIFWLNYIFYSCFKSWTSSSSVIVVVSKVLAQCAIKLSLENVCSTFHKLVLETLQCSTEIGTDATASKFSLISVELWWSGESSHLHYWP